MQQILLHEERTSITVGWLLKRCWDLLSIIYQQQLAISTIKLQHYNSTYRVLDKYSSLTLLLTWFRMFQHWCHSSHQHSMPLSKNLLTCILLVLQYCSSILQPLTCSLLNKILNWCALNIYETMDPLPIHIVNWLSSNITIAFAGSFLRYYQEVVVTTSTLEQH